MIRKQEATGKTVDEARAKACALLGVQADDLNVSCEVLEMPQKTGFLGLKTTPAKVRVSVEEPDAPAEAPVEAAPAAEEKAPAEQPVEAAPAVEEQPAPEAQPEEKAEEPAAPAAEQAAAPVAEEEETEVPIVIKQRLGGFGGVAVRGGVTDHDRVGGIDALLADNALEQFRLGGRRPADAGEVAGKAALLQNGQELFLRRAGADVHGHASVPAFKDIHDAGHEGRVQDVVQRTGNEPGAAVLHFLGRDFPVEHLAVEPCEFFAAAHPAVQGMVEDETVAGFRAERLRHLCEGFGLGVHGFEDDAVAVENDERKGHTLRLRGTGRRAGS